MKISIAITIIFLTSTLHADDLTKKRSKNDSVPVGIFGISLGIHSSKLINILKIKKDSKVLVGNINNPRPIDLNEKRKHFDQELRIKYPNADKTLLDALIKKISPLKLGSDVYEVSCTDKFCNTSFFSANKINYFIARFNSKGYLGNLSIHQKLSENNPSVIIERLIKTYGKTDILGNSKRSLRRQLDYGTAGKYVFRIKVLTRKTFSQVEYSLQNLDVFMQDIDEINKIMTDFELSLSQ